MDWRSTPSLAALRAVEAAGRCGSLTKAAAELNVTHAAIAQHVRTVEDFVGRPLLVRQGRGMVPTPHGAILTQRLSAGFAEIIAGVRDVMAEAAEAPLSITVTPSFAENWLMPRLGGFWAAHPEITISVTPSMDVADLRRDGFDLAIRYGRGTWNGLDSILLAPADYVVVAAPELLGDRQVRTITELSDLPWVFETVHRETRAWAIAEGLDPQSCQTKELPTVSTVLSAARAGAGVTVVSMPLVEGDIAAGRLVPVIERPQTGQGYHIVTRPGPQSPRLKTFIKWLRSVA